MPKFKVTICQHVREAKTIIVEAADMLAAAEVAYDSDEFLDGNNYDFQSIPDRWVECAEPMETEDGKA